MEAFIEALSLPAVSACHTRQWLPADPSLHTFSSDVSCQHAGLHSASVSAWSSLDIYAAFNACPYACACSACWQQLGRAAVNINSCICGHAAEHLKSGAGSNELSGCGCSLQGHAHNHLTCYKMTAAALSCRPCAGGRANPNRGRLPLLDPRGWLCAHSLQCAAGTCRRLF